MRPRWFEHPTFGFGVPLGYSLILDESFSLSQKDNPTKVSQVIFNWNHIFHARAIIGNLECFLYLSVRKVYEILLTDLNNFLVLRGSKKCSLLPNYIVLHIRHEQLFLEVSFMPLNSLWEFHICPYKVPYLSLMNFTEPDREYGASGQIWTADIRLRSSTRLQLDSGRIF